MNLAKVVRTSLIAHPPTIHTAMAPSSFQPIGRT
jgi:hypothetical protein